MKTIVTHFFICVLTDVLNITHPNACRRMEDTEGGGVVSSCESRLFIECTSAPRTAVCFPFIKRHEEHVMQRYRVFLQDSSEDAAGSHVSCSQCRIPV